MRLYEFFTNLYEISDAVKKRMREKFKQADQNLTDAQVNYYLDRWDRYSNNFPLDKKDITRLSFREVEQLIDSAEASAKLKGRGRDKQEQATDWIYNKDNIVIFKGDSKQKCMNYGRGYSWCISRADASNMFNSYRFDGKDRVFYYVFDKNLPTDDPWHAIVVHVLGNGKLVVTTATNSEDKAITWEELLQKKPRLQPAKSLFAPSPPSKEEADEYKKFKSKGPRDFDNFSVSDKIKYIEFGGDLGNFQIDQLSKNLLSLYSKYNIELTKSAWKRLSLSDFKYALRNIKTGNDIGYALNYLPPVDFFDDNPEKKEAYSIILANASKDKPRLLMHLLLYHGINRLPEAEPYIMKDSSSAYQYAKDVLKRRWPEAEPYIMKDSISAYRYAKNVLKRQWPEAEPVIMKDEYSWDEYKEHFGIK